MARIVAIAGKPRLRGVGEKNWHVCRKEDLIPGGATLMTAETDCAEIELPDGTRVRLDYDTCLEVAKAPVEGTNTRPATLFLRSGKIWLLVTRAQAEMVVYTPTAQARALGTIFVLSVETGARGFRERREGFPAAGLQTSIAVIRGKVELSNKHGAITVGEGGCAEATTGRPVAFPDAAERVKAIRLQAPWGGQGFIEWAPERLSWADSLKKLAGRRAWLGVELAPAPLTDGPEANGLSVIRVLTGLPAEKADIKPGDRVVRMDELTIGSREDLVRSELLFAPGQHVRLLIEREGQARQVTVTLAASGISSLHVGGDTLERANRQFATRELGAATRAYEEMIEKGEQKPAALNNAGVAYEFTDRVESAVVAYREAVRLAPKVVQYRFNLAMGLFRIGNLPRAADELEAALASDSAFADARFLLGKIRALSGEYEAAMEQARFLQALPATSAQGCCLMGEVSMLRGDAKEAESWYLRATQADPLYLDPQVYLARAYFVQGRLDKAQQSVESTLKLDPSSLEALNGLGLILLRRDCLDEAEQVLVKAAALHPESGKVYNNLGLLYLRKGNLAASRAAYQNAVALKPAATWCHAGLAFAMEQSGQFDAAKKEYAVALRLDPAYEAVYQHLASLHERLGEIQLAQNVLDRARQYGL